MEHIVLLGDSIFDNAAYVPEGSQVERQLQACLPGYAVSLLACDGAELADMRAALALFNDVILREAARQRSRYISRARRASAAVFPQLASELPRHEPENDHPQQQH